jgi:secreted trypsin-like serine protease
VRGSTLDAPAAGSGIVRGEVVKSSNAMRKSVVALVAEQPDGEALCTATLLSNNLALTAAHCVDGSPEKMTVVFAPKLKGAKPENVREAVDYAQNPLWGKNLADGRGDLAVVRFEGGLPEGYEPVALADERLALEPGERTVLLGYGVSNGKRETGSGVLRETETGIIGAASPTEFATDGERTSACFGDSGGPAFVRRGDGWVQWGVASAVTSHACNKASIHTAVMRYRPWIEQAIAKLGSPGEARSKPRSHTDSEPRAKQAPEAGHRHRRSSEG